MPCEHHKNALIEAAASSASPAGELRAHLDACASCREAFAQEQSLFAAIDSGLHTVANAEVPPSLLPRVRAGLEEIGVTHPRWSFGWMVVTSAAVASAALFLAITLRQNHLRTLPTNSAAIQPAIPKITASAQGSQISAPLPNGHSLSPQPFAAVVRNSPPSEPAVSSKSAPEVLVPRDEELLLASYAQQWSSRKRPPLVAGNANQSTVALLEVPPIQITELDVKPLAEGNSQ